MMPAEWAPHRATWIAWPHEKGDWPGKFDPIPWVYGEIIRHLSRHERVNLLVQNASEERRAKALLKRTGGEAAFHRIPTDRVWMRDTSPTFTSGRTAVCWRFNGWAKYPNHKRDAEVGEAIARITGAKITPAGMVMEGGAIDVDGAGLLMATEECLLSKVQARNPGLGREGTERVFKEILGIRKVIWLGRGIVGDDTHGHIDDVARFVAPGRVLLCTEKNPKDLNFKILNENRERLKAARLDVIALPMPRPLFFEGVRVPASYANFYIANGLVLVPTFNDPADRTALGILADLFPDREVIGLHAVDFVWGLGTIHCATQQQPA